jgi:putative ABC transport system ATP-binding protein
MTVTAEDISKEYIRQGRGTNRFAAVSGVSLTLEGGSLSVVTGRSGSGKTTLLNMLAGLLSPSSGRVLLDGRDIYGLDDKTLSRLRCESFGVVPQGQSAVRTLTVEENILLPFMLYKENGGREYALELMKRLGIAELASVKPSELSGGELRRMSIARAVIRRPGVIFADEPTGDLDDENTALVFDFLKQLAGEGSAVMVVSHENDALKYADRVMKMSAGKFEIMKGA